MKLAGIVISLFRLTAAMNNANGNIYYEPGTGCGLQRPLKVVSMCWIDLWYSGFEAVTPCTVVSSPGHLVCQARERQLKDRGGIRILMLLVASFLIVVDF